MTNSGYDVFISYKSEDVRLAELLNKRLIEAGFSVWFDRIRLSPGFRWHDEIQLGCENSRILLPVLTPRWQTSEWTKFETYGAESIIPLHFEGSWEEVATPPLQYHQNAVIDFRETDESDWQNLFAAARRLLEKPTPEKPERIAHLKFRSNPFFTGREAELTRMHESLHRGPTTALTQGEIYAVTALGGWGKTTLAREYVEKFWRLYPQIFWVDVQTDPVPGFAAIARTLRPHLVDLPDETLAKAALHALSDRTERLLVLDSVDNEESILDWIPKSGGCHTIITSHFTAWKTGLENEPLFLLDPLPSRELLLKRAGRENEESNWKAADRLAAELGCLPIALEQAAAYVKEEGADFGFDDYIDIYRRATKEILGDERPGSAGYVRPVATAWMTTVDRLSWEARAVLRIASFLAPRSIPKSLFFKSAGVIDDLARVMRLMATGELKEPAQINAPDVYVRRILQELAAYSMITNHGHSFSIHTMVQTVERAGIPESEVERCATIAIAVVGAARPKSMNVVQHWSEWHDWIPHARSVIARSEEAGVSTGLEDLCGLAGAWLERMASFFEAEYLLGKALQLEVVASGEDSLRVAIRRNNLAGLLRTTGRLRESGLMFNQALETLEKHLGPDHETVAVVLNNLGLIHRPEGRLGEALFAFQRALRIFEAVGHLADRANLQLNLGSLLCEMLQYVEAETHLAQALHFEETTLGYNHPSIAQPLLNQATLYLATNRFPEAESVCRRALSICEAAFGPDHPEVAVCVNDLARVFQEMGRNVDAEPLLERALEIDLAVHGPDHEKVAIRLNNLAGVMKKTGRLEEAESAMRRSLEIRGNALGPDNKLTYHMRSRLSDVLRRRKQFVEAEDLARSSIRSWERSESPRAYKAGRAWRNLALILRDTGRRAEAAETMQRAVAIYEEVLVPGDPRLEAIREEIGRMRAGGADTGA